MDPRPAIQKVMSRKKEFNFKDGTYPEWYFKQ